MNLTINSTFEKIYPFLIGFVVCSVILCAAFGKYIAQTNELQGLLLSMIPYIVIGIFCLGWLLVQFMLQLQIYFRVRKREGKSNELFFWIAYFIIIIFLNVWLQLEIREMEFRNAK